MIYEMDNKFIDLSKLEYVSEIKEKERNHEMAPSGDGFYFSFLINGTPYSINLKEHKFTTKVIKNDLIKAWKEYKDQK